MIPAPSIQPELSRDAKVVLESIQELGGEATWMPYAALGQELLDAGLVARTMHADGRVTYRLTEAGRRWRAA